MEPAIVGDEISRCALGKALSLDGAQHVEKISGRLI
jgi:hypothetical protein